MDIVTISRRQFLARLGKGTLAIGFSFAPITHKLLGGEARAAGTESDLTIDSWLTIDQQGTITIFSGKVELGTGVQTAMMQIVAEELDVGFARLNYVQGDTSQTPDEGFTAGSKSVQTQGPALRVAAATAFQVLLNLASQQLNVPVANLVANDGRIGIGPNLDEARSYEQLIAGQQIELPSNPNVPVKSPSDYRIVGQPVPRVELPAKFTAQFTYVADVVLDGMLHGRVIRPSGRNATLDSVDPISIQSAQAIPGFLKIVRVGNFVGVVATDEWAAIQASRTIQVKWNAGAPLQGQGSSLPQTLQDPANTYQTSQEQVRGDVDSALDSAVTRLQATYFNQYQMHGAFNTSCGVADVRRTADATGVRVTIWSSTQGVFPLQGAIADLLGMPVSAVRVIYVEAAGCYGHNGADDVCADAAVLSQFMGKPVRVQWSRQDEHGWEPLGPAMAHQMNGGLDRNGGVAAWEHIVFTPTHDTRPSDGGSLLAGQEFGRLPPALPDAPTNAGTRNGPINYTFANSRLIANHVRIYSTVGGGPVPSAPLTNTLLRPSALRSLGGFSNTFANESFMDELATASATDPLAFRLGNLSDPRAIAVLNAMAQQAGWGQPLGPGMNGLLRGRGIAFLRYETVETYVAAYAEVQVNPGTGAVQVMRVVVAHDCGLIINPDGLRNQIEGNVMQGVSRTLIEKVSFDANGVTSLLWSTYPVLHFTDVPLSVEIVLIDHPTEPSWGAGEPTTLAMPAAIGNAFFNATGVRLRALPFTADVVKAALA